MAGIKLTPGMASAVEFGRLLDTFNRDTSEMMRDLAPFVTQMQQIHDQLAGEQPLARITKGALLLAVSVLSARAYQIGFCEKCYSQKDLCECDRR